MAGDRDRIFRNPRLFRVRDREAGFFERVAHRVELVGRGEDLERFAVAGHVVGAGVEREFEQLVLVDGGFFNSNYPALFEHPADASDFAEVAAAAGEDEAQLRDGAIAIVRQHVDHDRDAAGAVAFVGDFLERRARDFAGALLDRSIDVVVGHRLFLGDRDRRAQARIGIDVAAAEPRRDRDFLDRTPFRMTRHGKYLPRGHLGGRVPNDAEIIIKVRERGNAKFLRTPRQTEFAFTWVRS